MHLEFALPLSTRRKHSELVFPVKPLLMDKGGCSNTIGYYNAYSFTRDFKQLTCKLNEQRERVTLSIGNLYSRHIHLVRAEVISESESVQSF